MAETISGKSLETLVTRVIIQVFNVAGNIVIARTLGPYGKGIFTYMGATLSLLITLTAGQSAAVAFQLAKKKLADRTIFDAMLRILAAITLPAVLVCIALAIFQKGQWPLAVVAAALPFNVYNQATTGFFMARSAVRVVNIQLLFTTVLFTLIAIPILLVARLGLNGLVWVWVACMIAATAYVNVRLRPFLKPDSVGASPIIIRDQFWFGAKVSLNALISYLNFRIDIFIILALLGAKALGIYSIGIGFGELMWQLSRPISIAAYGKIASGTMHEAAILTAKCMRHAIWMVFIGAVVIYTVGPSLVTLVYGQQFAPAGLVVRFLLPGIIVYSAMPILSTFFTQQMGKPVVPLVFSALSMILCALVTFFTIRKIGIVGGAIATSISYLVAFAAASIFFSRNTGISPRSMFVLDASDLREYLALMRSTWRKAARLVAR